MRVFKVIVGPQDPEEYWGNIAQNTIWHQPWTRVLDNSNPPFSKWFVDAELSLVYNAVDRHVDEGFGSQTALVWDSPITNSKRSLTYSDLKKEVSQFAKVLRDTYDVKKGDRVIIYMPMILETIIAMLAVARLGAIHSVVFGGFSAKELSLRIKHIEAKLVITASCGIEPNRLIKYKPIVDEALIRAEVPELPVIVYQRENICQTELKPGRDSEWQDLIEGASVGDLDCVPVLSNDPLYVLYTSGTTGSPKGVQIPVGPHAVVNKWTMKAVYGMKKVSWRCMVTYSDMGWAVGHGYVCYSPLLHRNTSIVFEGKPAGTPDAGQFSRVIAENQVKGFSLHPLPFLLVGERCDNSTKEWASHHFKVPILDHWWQTETAHPMTGHCIGLGNTLNPPKDSTGRPVPGFDIRVVDENGKHVANGEMGRIVCKLPIAPGCLSTLYGNDEGFVGHRLSISRLEEVLISHPDVVDCAVVGVRDELKGQIPIGLIVLKKHFHQEDLSSLKEELVQQVRSNVGAVAALKILLSVNNLPRTRSGKITRKCIADMAMGLSIKIPATIEDATVFDEIRQVLVENLNLDIPSPQ
ncbi:ACSS3 [Lepeophtheirus salmonis]|uniref:Acyl-CoA synthetase short-chain family member 3, mitochondrial n=1 Tax=Lepeophtheirus salmonis TaxID=72036 RepID=A0A7R8D3N5_LEPSM|nr:ACSS3 [Lepeophtheirus salmonis]CAF2985185.1 ACSS3 [Lepeophtheirus salmonis]